MSISHHLKRSLIIFTLLLATFAFTSCSRHIGYGVITWSESTHGLFAGDIVPVYIQSNIGKVYVIGVGKGFRKHIEIPLWQLNLYKSKGQAKKAAKAMNEYRYSYALVKLDGLPMRALPENTARQVYRFKAGQKVKIVGKGQGSPVFAGNSPLQGDWLEVMSDDGTLGWCFSYNLALFDERDATGGSAVVDLSGPDPVLENLLARSWYPDVYRTMLADNRIDLQRIQLSWGFFPGADSNIARIDTAEGIVTFPYSSIIKNDDTTYRFDGSTLIVQIRSEGTIAVQYTDANGMPQVLYFASLDITPEQIVQNEKQRRADILAVILKAGPRFSSGNYGVLQFLPGGRFLWSGYQLLSPSVIPSGAGAGGLVDFRCFLPATLASGFTGVLSFRFDGTGQWIHFLYTLSSQGLKLEQVSESNIKDSTVISQNLSPTVIFFTPGGPSQDGQ